jgi:hypothetical protein
MELSGQQTRKKDEYLHTHTDGDARERNPFSTSAEEVERCREKLSRSFFFSCFSRIGDRSVGTRFV